MQADAHWIFSRYLSVRSLYYVKRVDGITVTPCKPFLRDPKYIVKYENIYYMSLLVMQIHIKSATRINYRFIPPTVTPVPSTMYVTGRSSTIHRQYNDAPAPPHHRR